MTIGDRWKALRARIVEDENVSEEEFEEFTAEIGVLLIDAVIMFVEDFHRMTLPATRYRKGGR